MLNGNASQRQSLTKGRGAHSGYEKSSCGPPIRPALVWIPDKILPFEGLAFWFRHTCLLPIVNRASAQKSAPDDLQRRALTTTTPPSRTEADNLLAETRGDMMNKKLTHQK